MKKTQLLNSDLSRVIARMGHTDTICICDAGLPIPGGVERIDLAVVRGLPGFTEVLEAVLLEMAVEKVLFASEMENENAGLWEHLNGRFADIERVRVSHAQLKELTKNCVAVVRTGECKSYANIILQAGVAF